MRSYQLGALLLPSSGRRFDLCSYPSSSTARDSAVSNRPSGEPDHHGLRRAALRSLRFRCSSAAVRLNRKAAELQLEHLERASSKERCSNSSARSSSRSTLPRVVEQVRAYLYGVSFFESLLEILEFLEFSPLERGHTPADMQLAAQAPRNRSINQQQEQEEERQRAGGERARLVASVGAEGGAEEEQARAPPRLGLSGARARER